MMQIYVVFVEVDGNLDRESGSDSYASRCNFPRKYRTTRITANPPSIKHTLVQKLIRGYIFYSFFDRPFIIRGTLNTTPPSDVRLE